MQPIIDLRTPSFIYNHGGYYAPGDPRDCNMPGGPCCYCQDRIDEEDAAEALVLLSQTPACCADRPGFLEPCPDCNAVGTYVTHESRGVRRCNGCGDKLCINCFFGARYYCPLRAMQPPLSPPHGPLVRQEALGVQSPKAEEKRENK
jgi:hypothetical protein